MRTTTDLIRQPLRKPPKSEHKILWLRILFTILGLLAFGIIEVFSASRYQGVQLTGNPLYFGLIHLAFVIAGLLIMLIMQIFSIEFLKKITGLMFFGIMILLIAVFFFEAENGSHRWIEIGNTNFGVQPSELAKVVSIMIGASLFANLKWNIDKLYSDHISKFFITSIPIILVLLLILFEPDLGNIIVIGASYFGMYLLTESKWKKTDIAVFFFAGILLGIFALVLEPYRVERVTTHINFIQTGEIEDEFGSGLQLRNILIGVGSGGLWGKGIGGSRLRYGYFVEVTAFTDSIAAVIFEELGFFLSILFVGIYVFFFLSLVQLAELQKDQYQRFLIWGIALWFIGQSLFHFGANVALVPVKGITLPFISYGGSSMIAFAVAMGIVLKVARNT